MDECLLSEHKPSTGAFGPAHIVPVISYARSGVSLRTNDVAALLVVELNFRYFVDNKTFLD